MTISVEEYGKYDGIGLAGLVRKGEVHPSELLAAAMGRADAVNPGLNAIIERFDDRARLKATQALPAGTRFAGVPFLTKALGQEIEGLPISQGCMALRNYVASESADVVRRWEAEGLLIFGSTNTPEFGSKNVTEPRAHGPARNPWDRSRTPGGSSGGSAAAIAAGVVPMAGASDGGGSIRIPAAACGLLGLKASRGRIPGGPSAGEGIYGSAVQGVITRSVRDSAAMLDVMQGPEPHAPYYMPRPEQSYLEAITRPPRRLRVGFATASPLGSPVHADAAAAVEDAARLLQGLGHDVEEAAPRIDGRQMSQDFLTSWFCYVAAAVQEIRGKTGAARNEFDPDTLAMADAGRTVSAVELMQTHGRWQNYVNALARYHQKYDLLLTPVLSEPPLPIGHTATPRLLQLGNDIVSMAGLTGMLRKTRLFQDTVLKNLAWTPFTQLANITGRPAMSVPLYWTQKGLPLGVQFVGGLNSEALLLQLAAQLEQARPWFDRRPAT